MCRNKKYPGWAAEQLLCKRTIKVLFIMQFVKRAPPLHRGILGLFSLERNIFKEANFKESVISFAVAANWEMGDF